MVCFVMDSRLPPGIPRHLHALVGPSVAFVFLVSLISFLVHHWCPDAKGKSQEERPVHLGKVGKGGDSVQVCAQGRSHRHRAVFLSSLPSFLPSFPPPSSLSFPLFLSFLIFTWNLQHNFKTPRDLCISIPIAIL